MYRALTDSPPHKKHGYIIDLNMRRIVNAVFDYDVVKSQNTRTGREMTREERIQKILDLCNWGQDAFIQDNPSVSLSDMMATIQDKVFSRLRAKLRSEYQADKLAERQVEMLEKTTRQEFNEMYKDLKYTSFGKQKVPKGENVYEHGEDYERDDATRGDSSAAPPPKEDREGPKGLAVAQFKKKLVNMFVTFINALIIKSDIPWESTITIDTLLKRYNEDKKTAKEDISACGCRDDTTSTNVYDIVFCELQSYARTQVGESYQYDEATHKKIMKYLDKLFIESESRSFAPDWNLYIASLIADLTGKNGSSSRNELNPRQ
jgi:hypothetical protein